MAKDKLIAIEHIVLWNNFLNGSKEAYSEIYELFAADLYRYGYNLVKNKEMVERHFLTCQTCEKMSPVTDCAGLCYLMSVSLLGFGIS